MSLQVTRLSKSYAGVQALQEVSFTLEPGSLCAMIGPNGAGKSTCFACLAGQLKADAGTVHWQGAALDGLSPAARLHAGVGRTFQVAQVFEALTVQQNLHLLTDAQHATQLLDAVALLGLAQQLARDLPYGAKKRLELALALAGKPRLLLLDEPAAGLNETERHALMRLVKALTQPVEHTAQPLTVLYTEHNMDAVFGVADRVLVLVEGRLLADGTPSQIAANPQVRHRYLGESFAAEDRDA